MYFPSGRNERDGVHEVCGDFLAIKSRTFGTCDFEETNTQVKGARNIHTSHERGGQDHGSNTYGVAKSRSTVLRAAYGHENAQNFSQSFSRLTITKAFFKGPESFELRLVFFDKKSTRGLIIIRFSKTN